MNNQTALAITIRTREIIAQANSQIAELLAVAHPEDYSFAAGFQMLDTARIKYSSWKAVGEKVGLNGEQIKSYIELLRLLRARENNLHADPVALNKSLIAGLQLVNLLELVKGQHPDLIWSSSWRLPETASAGNAVRQMRAIELLIRSVIDEAWADQEQLIARMQTILNEAQVQRIVKNAEKGNVLSGTLLEQLRQIFADKEDFPEYYDSYFDTTPALNYASTTRETLSLFLQELNHIRNKIAHYKTLSEAELLLLNEYFDQVVEPLRAAHQEGRLKTDPDTLYNASAEAIKLYQQQVEQQLDEIKQVVHITDEKAKAIKQDTGILRRNVRWILAGVVGVAAITAVTLRYSGGSFVNTEIIKDQVSEVQQKLGNVKQESSNDPRKELANTGVKWDQSTMEQAIRRGDLRTVQLFNDGGMTWHTNFYIAALSEWYNEDKNKGRRQVIEYLTAHPENRILVGYGGNCLYATEVTRAHEKKGDADDALNNMVIKSLCNNDSARADIKRVRQEFTDNIAQLNDEFSRYNQTPAACVKEKMRDNGNKLYSDIQLAGSIGRDNYAYRLNAENQAAFLTYENFSAFQNNEMPLKTFKAAIDYFCKSLSENARQSYPKQIAEVTAQRQSLDDALAKAGIKL